MMCGPQLSIHEIDLGFRVYGALSHDTEICRLLDRLLSFAPTYDLQLLG